MHDTLELDERAANAKALLNNSLFKEAVDKLRGEYTAKLIQTEPGTLTAAAAHASLRALEDVIAGLQSVINDQKMAKQTGKSSK